MNMSDPGEPFGYPTLTDIGPGLVGNISQADAQQSYLVGATIALREAVPAWGAFYHTIVDDEYSNHYMDPIDALSFDDVNHVPMNVTGGGIGMTVLISHNNQ